MQRKKSKFLQGKASFREKSDIVIKKAALCEF